MRLDRPWCLLVLLVLLPAVSCGFDLGRIPGLAAGNSSQADLPAWWRASMPGGRVGEMQR